MKRIPRPVFIGCLLAIFVCMGRDPTCGDEASHSVGAPSKNQLLDFYPTSGTIPQPLFKIDFLMNNDVSEPGTGNRYAYFNSLLDVFAGEPGGQNEDSRESFRHEFIKYLSTKHAPGLGLQCPPPTIPDGNVQLVLPNKPYEWHQTEFLRFLNPDWDGRATCDNGVLKDSQGRPLKDFLTPLARQPRGPFSNPFNMDDQSCPLQSSDLIENKKLELLQRAQGYLVSLSPDIIDDTIDNRYNPMRWIGHAGGSVHHHGCPGLSVIFPLSAASVDTTKQLLAPIRAGQPIKQHLFLDYDVELQVEDFRKVVSEETIYDILPDVKRTNDGIDLSGPPPKDLLGRTLWNTFYFSRPSYNAVIDEIGAKTNFDAPQQQLRFLQTRYIQPFVNMSIAVDFKRGGGLYRDAEFMLFAKNYANSNILSSDNLGTEYFDPIANPAFLKYTPEGAVNGTVGWTRTQINAFKLPMLSRRHPDAMPIVSDLVPGIPGGQFVGQTADDYDPLNRRFAGRIDLTNYYKVSLAEKIFPGQLAKWSGVTVGFESEPSKKNRPAYFPKGSDNLVYPDPNETHEIHYVGVLMEVHGPFRVRTIIRTVQLHVENR